MQKFVLKNWEWQSLGKYLEIGCGTGYVLKGVKTTFKNADVFGSEIFLSGLEQAKRRLSDVNLMQMDARAIPYQDEFDVIGASDVLEHIKEDEKVISEVYRTLKPGSFLLRPCHSMIGYGARWMITLAMKDAINRMSFRKK